MNQATAAAVNGQPRKKTVVTVPKAVAERAAKRAAKQATKQATKQEATTERKRKTVVRDCDEADYAEWLAGSDEDGKPWGLYRELRAAYGPGKLLRSAYETDSKGKPRVRSIVIPVPLLKACRTHQTAAVLSRLVYWASHNPIPTNKLPDELKDRPGPWIRTSANRLHEQCHLARGTIDAALARLQTMGVIEVASVHGRLWIHPNLESLQRAIRKAYKL